MTSPARWSPGIVTLANDGDSNLSSCWCKWCRLSSAKVDPILQALWSTEAAPTVADQGEVDDLLASLGF